jgi:hypothetical protein
MSSKQALLSVPNPLAACKLAIAARAAYAVTIETVPSI